MYTFYQGISFSMSIIINKLPICVAREGVKAIHPAGCAAISMCFFDSCDGRICLLMVGNCASAQQLYQHTADSTRYWSHKNWGRLQPLFNPESKASLNCVTNYWNYSDSQIFNYIIYQCALSFLNQTELTGLKQITKFWDHSIIIFIALGSNQLYVIICLYQPVFCLQILFSISMCAQFPDMNRTDNIEVDSKVCSCLALLALLHWLLINYIL